ncbi:MAG TPA: GspH/FimT family pseudopilin [Casimicrobiaceae bacterium]|nr:GspH/FimT family pseudopilin [Casimicrobiaceae bacterium]
MRKTLAGFTLLEIIVVVAILGIVAGLAVALMQGDERGDLDRETRRFAGALEYASQRAQLRHETLGVSASGSEWRFWTRGTDGRWRTISDDDALRARSLPQPLRAAPVSYAGQPLPETAIVPLRSTGRNEPYAFALVGERLQSTIASDLLNRVSVNGPISRTP